jgi:hypothetical protein
MSLLNDISLRHVLSAPDDLHCDIAEVGATLKRRELSPVHHVHR